LCFTMASLLPIVAHRTDGLVLAPFRTVDPFRLQRAGLTVTEAVSAAPPTGSKVATRKEAGRIGAAKMPGRVIETRFVHCNSPISRDCWVVSMDPSGFASHGPSSTTATYAVAVIDPISGKVLRMMAGGG
jgi:hypothetical protein